MGDFHTDLKRYVNSLITDVLPRSDLAMMKVNKNGLVMLDSNNSTDYFVELPDSVKAGIYEHEKCSTTRRGILIPGTSTTNPKFHSYYIRPFSGNLSALEKIIAQSVLELYPVPLATYGVVTNASVAPTIGASVVDLNHLITQDGHPVQSIRLDMLLHSLGLGKDIYSFLDLQRVLSDENITKLASPRALVQLALSSYFIPNSIGEVDANSRNIIMLKSPESGKYEYAVRIDAESNTYFNQINGERSGQKRVPKGIFTANESFEDEFLKAIKQKDRNIDWELFAGFMLLNEKMTSQSKIDNAIFSGFQKNYNRVSPEDMRFSSAVASYFGLIAYEDFSKETIARAKRFNDYIFSALSMPQSKIPYEDIEMKPSTEKFSMKTFDKFGQEIEPEK